MNILQALVDPNLFGPSFRDRSTYGAWEAALAALFGLPLTPEQMQLYTHHTGRTEPPSGPSLESYWVVGRRGGKSKVLSAVAAYLGCFFDYSPYLDPGERGVVLLIASDKSQAKVAFGYVRALIMGSPILARMVKGKPTRECIDLNNGVSIQVGTASYRAPRGKTIVSAIIDELAFLRTSDDSAVPDHEVINAIMPAMMTIPNAMFLGCSSPYRKQGVLWEQYKANFRKNGAPLVWKGASREMNPKLPQAFIDREYAKDAASADAEYGANFRNDLESFVSIETVEACVDKHVIERPPQQGIHYHAFTDAAGGSGQDAFCLAIGHLEGKQVIVDAVREQRPPFNPIDVVARYADLLRNYRITTVVGDRWASGFNAETWRSAGLSYRQSEKPASGLYADLLPALNARTVTLPNLPRLISQIASLERRVGASGKDLITHPKHEHDDVANAVAGLISMLSSRSQPTPLVIGSYGIGYASGPTSIRNWTNG